MRKFDDLNICAGNPVILFAYQKTHKGDSLVRFFNRMGFETTPRSPVYLKYGDNDDIIEIVRMEKCHFKPPDALKTQK